MLIIPEELNCKPINRKSHFIEQDFLLVVLRVCYHSIQAVELLKQMIENIITNAFAVKVVLDQSMERLP